MIVLVRDWITFDDFFFLSIGYREHGERRVSAET